MAKTKHREIETKILIEMYEPGNSLREISAQRSITYQAVQLRFKKTGIELRRSGAAAVSPRLDRKLLVELYENQKLSPADIEKQLNLPKNSLRCQLEMHHIPLRNPPAAAHNKWGAKPSREELERLYVTGNQSQEEIGAHFGKTRKTISKWILGCGLKRKMKPETIRKRKQRGRWRKTESNSP